MRIRVLQKSDTGVESVASVALFNDKGELLFGRRKDSGKYTLAGGHLEEGEKPQHAAIREVLEETCLIPSDLKYLGEETLVAPETKKTIRVYAFKAQAQGHGIEFGDPDEECETWEWVDVSQGIPGAILNNLHAPRNVVLGLLGLQKETDLAKMALIYDHPTFAMAMVP